MTGNVVIYIPIGGTGSDQFSMANRWRKDPYGTFVREFIKAKNWCDISGVPLRLCLFQPAGYPPSGVMPIDSWANIAAVDQWYCSEIERLIREFSTKCTEFLIYVGSLAAFDGSMRDLKRSLVPYSMQGYTSIAIDQSAGLTRDSASTLARLDGAFWNVLIEGQYKVENDWMRPLYPNLVMARWQPSSPEKYLPLQGGDYVIVTGVPDELSGDKSEASDKTSWRVAQCRKWLPLGVNCIIGVDELAGQTYTSLVSP